MLTYAITGANGFIGVHIIHHLLDNGHRIKAVIREEASLELFEQVALVYDHAPDAYDRLEWHRHPLYDTNSIADVFASCDVVIHAAGLISYSRRDRELLLQVNRDYTHHVVNAALLAGVRRLIYCSSTAAISKDGKDTVVESREWDPKLSHSYYGYTKHLGELETYRGMEEGLEVAVVNPGIVLGYGNWNAGSNKLFRNASRNFPFYSRGVTGFVGVRDVARAIELLSSAETNGERYLLVAENRSYMDVANMMCDALGSKRPYIEVKGLLYHTIHSFIAFKEKLGLGGMLTRETVRASVSRNEFSNEKIEQLGFQFDPLQQTIERAAKAYKKSPPK